MPVGSKDDSQPYVLLARLIAAPTTARSGCATGR